MKLKRLLIIACGAALLSSCNTSKTTLPYFTDIAKVESGEFKTKAYDLKIKPDDELYIMVTSEVPLATAHYNLPVNNTATREKMVETLNPRLQTYVVNSEGDITFPVLGTVHVAGLTTAELQKYLTEEISKDVDNPIVRVQLVNFTVNVGGEVTKPGTVEVNPERFSILDALSAAGDLTPYGERSNVLLVREENGTRKFVHLDLNSSELLNSPYFYLQQNDYVYVEPNKVRQANSRYNQDNAYKLSLTSTIVSAASVIASLVIALTIR